MYSSDIFVWRNVEALFLVCRYVSRGNKLLMWQLRSLQFDHPAACCLWCPVGETAGHIRFTRVVMYMSPSTVPLHMGDLGLHLIYGFCGLLRVCPQMASWSTQPYLQVLTLAYILHLTAIACIELLPALLPQTPHGHLTAFCTCFWRSPLIITLVLFSLVKL